MIVDFEVENVYVCCIELIFMYIFWVIVGILIFSFFVLFDLVFG